MPRHNNKSRTTEKIATTYYNHNEQYTSMVTEQKYTKKDSLIYWSDFCVKKSGSTVGLNGSTTTRTAGDQSKDASAIQLYAPDAAAQRTFTESETQYMISLLPGGLQEIVTQESLDVCGDPCFWLNLSMGAPVSGDEAECTLLSVGPDYLFAEDTSQINFSDAGATQDTPFSISIWYYPIDYVGNPNALYNKGGSSKLLAPAILHKTFQYGLFIRECGKLEFVLYDTDITASINSTDPKNPTYTYAGTSKSLTVRSKTNILIPGQWNHITVTYDGTGTRSGMKIYVNCVNAVNPADVPPVSGSESQSITNTPSITLCNQTHSALMTDIYAVDGETPGDYVAMHKYATPLMFASTAIPTNASSMIGLSVANMGMQSYTQLPWSFIFDVAIWSSELTAEDVGAVCDATKNCIALYSDVYGNDSGYINLSPKIMQKTRDQKQNNLSVIDRVGDRSDRRVKSREPFNDRYSLIFGKRISDELKEGNYSFLSLNTTAREQNFKIPVAGIIPDTQLWVVQNAMIKREQKIDVSSKLYDKALSFSIDPGTSFIQTKEKVNNAIIYYDLILGPYNQKTGHLNLTPAKKSGSSLFVEIQTIDGGPWKIIKTHSATDKTDLTEFYSPNYDTGLILTPAQHKFRRSFKIHFTDIDAGGSTYKVRFRSDDSCWGIGRIDILSANQTIRPPLLIDHDAYAGKYIDQNFIATPHTRSDIETIGRTVSGISDTSIYFTDGNQKVSAFKDDILLPFAANTFFDEGIDDDVIPGFSSPLKDKTSFTINLDSVSDTDIGFVNKVSGGSGFTSAAYAQPMFASWDNISKQWKSPNSIDSLSSIGFKPIFVSASLEDQLKYHKQIFGTVDLIGSASGPTDNFAFNQFDSNILSSYNQPSTSFGFPHQSVYGIPSPRTPGTPMTVDSLLKMSDYITKPFLLEKVVIEFDAKFEFGAATESRRAFRVMYVSGTSSTGPSDRHYDNASLLIPSFYMLNVKKNVGKRYSSEIVLDDNGTLRTFSTPDSSFDYDFAGNKDKVGCDLITYGQMTMYITGSGVKMNMKKALEDGLGRDAVYDISKLNGQNTYSASGIINPITSSFRIEMPVRNMPRTGYTQRSIHKDQSNNYFGIFSNNPVGGRSLPTKSSGSLSNAGNIGDVLPITEFRGLINNFSTVNESSRFKYLLANTAQAKIPYTVDSSGFRLENDNKMTLGGNYKVHFYGSLIKEGKEFHENMNQALTTVEINEPIGCESVVDRFNIATRDEYYKSYLDKILIGASGKLRPSDAGSATNRKVYSFENRSTGVGSTRIFDTSIISPAARIGSKIGSKINHFHTYKVASASITAQGYHHSFTGVYTDTVIQPDLGALNTATLTNSSHTFRKSFTFPFTEHYNNNRQYQDEGKLLLTSSDGSIMHISGVLGKNQVLLSREKYIFSHNHFGYHSDIIDVAKDSSFTVRNILSEKSDKNDVPSRFLSSPVSIIFVSSSIDKDGILSYHKIQNTSAAQSLNLSIDSIITASFID